jgi:outer membrane protein assembly factor BamB
VAIACISGTLVAALQFAPGEQLPDQFRNFLSMVVGATAVVALLVWLAFFSRIPLRRRVTLLAVSLVLLAIPVVVVDHVEFTGDIEPDFVFRWEKDRSEILQAHRQQASRTVQNTDGQTEPTDSLDADWPGFRGRDRSGVYRGAPIRTNWTEQPPRPLWKQPIGEGLAQIALSGNLAITMEQRGTDEAVVCYDARTGAERWIHAYQTRFSETMGGDGPRATPTVDDGQVFALGANGRLTCLQADSGKVEWEVNILKGDGLTNLQWAMSGSPLILRELVIVSPGGPTGAIDKAVVAYNRHSGDVIWGLGAAPGGYASPVVAEIDGVEQILILEGEDVAAYQSDGSAELWRYAWPTQQGINCSQPVLVGENRVLITAGYMMGSALLHVTRSADNTWNVEPIWKKTTLRGKFSTPIAHNDHIYGLDEGILVCIDRETGERQWKQGRYGHGQILLAGEVLFIQAENGDLAIVAVDPDNYRELARIPALQGRTWNTPALAAGRAFVRNHREMACFDISR